MNTYDSSWQHYLNLLCETSQSTPKPLQEHKSSLEETMAELRRAQAGFFMVQAESERSMADMENSQVGLPRFQAQNGMSPPPQEKMTNLEATMVE